MVGTLWSPSQSKTKPQHRSNNAAVSVLTTSPLTAQQWGAQESKTVSV